MMTKNQELTLTCDRLGADLEGICDLDGQTVFVTGALPGETFDAKVVQVRPRYAFAKLMKLQNASPERVEPFCPAYVYCGGCSGQHMRYQLTLDAKRRQVYDCLTRIGGLTLTSDEVPTVLGAENTTRFRNKTSLPVGGTADAPMLGFFKRRSHSIVDIDDCPVAMGPLADVIRVVKSWIKCAKVAPYNELTFKGLLRHVIVRTTRSGELMVLLVATDAKLPKLDVLIERLSTQVEGFCSLFVSENRQHNNVILGRDCQKLYGRDVIVETLLGLDFEISPLSFFQVNADQTERLYAKALEYAALTPDTLAVDAYAGAGTIALQMARVCKRVIGLEIVPQAVESAKHNAERNHIANAEFQAAAVEEALPKLVADGLRPDVVVLDPPRKGVEPPVIEALLQAAPKRIVYVSCHVPTQARDVAALVAGGYHFVACQPVDLFCYAGGVENVLLLEHD